MKRTMAVVLGVLVALGLAAGAFAQSLPAASGGVDPSPAGIALGTAGESHAWFVLPKTTKDQWQLIHVPPRRSASSIDGLAHGAADGTLRVATLLNARPDAIAAYGRRVWIATPLKGGWVVRTATAELSGLGDLWRNEPADRLDATPDLKARGTLAGFVGTRLGPVALVTSGSEPAKLWALSGSAWHEVSATVPVLTNVVNPDLRILADGSDVLLVDTSGIGPRTYWRLSPKADAKAWHEGTETRSGRLVVAESGLSNDELAGGDWRFLAGRFVVAARRKPGELAIAVGTDRLVPALRLSGVKADYVLTGIEGLGRVLATWVESPEASPTPVPRGQDAPAVLWPLPKRVVECSVYSGRTLYAGVPVSASPVDPTEVRALVVALTVLTAGVLVFVLRGERAETLPPLPEGVRVADPARRLVATAVDAFVAAMVASRLSGMPIDVAFSVEAFGGPMLVFLVWTAVAGTVLGAVSECAWGRTLGKGLAGCMVLDASGTKPDADNSPITPSFWRSLLRNGIKWFVPPLALLGLWGTTGRHRGDVVARCVVIAPEEAEADGDED